MSGAGVKLKNERKQEIFPGSFLPGRKTKCAL